MSSSSRRTPKPTHCFTSPQPAPCSSFGDRCTRYAEITDALLTHLSAAGRGSSDAGLSPASRALLQSATSKLSDLLHLLESGPVTAEEAPAIKATLLDCIADVRSNGELAEMFRSLRLTRLQGAVSSTGPAAASSMPLGRASTVSRTEDSSAKTQASPSPVHISPRPLGKLSLTDLSGADVTAAAAPPVVIDALRTDIINSVSDALDSVLSE